MNRTAMRVISIMLAIVLFATSVPLTAIASIVSGEKTSSIQNEYIKVTVDNASGRFSIRTLDGQPIRKKDGNVDMIFGGDNPETSFTTFKIDGTEFIFGNPYKLAVDWFSEVSTPIVVNGSDGSQSIVTLWTIKDIDITQTIKILKTDDLENAGNVQVSYQVNNNSDATVEVGTRVLLDTSVGGNDGPSFQIGQNYLRPLTTERKLVHEPATLGYDLATDEQGYNLHKLPAYWVMRDKIDFTDPSATNVMAYGFNNMFEGGVHIVDEMIVGHWTGLANSKWDYEPNENVDFTTNTNQYGSADTAVAYYWNPDPIEAGGFKTYEVIYGLGEIITPDQVFDIRFLDTIQKLETTEDQSSYVNDGIFEINAEIENLEMFGMEHSKIKVTLQLESGLSFVDEAGQVVNSAAGVREFQKEISPEEAAAGIEVIPYQPGEIISAKWRVKGTGRLWPTTQDYTITVSSPETELKLEYELEDAADQDPDIRAVYESNKSNFIYLPPIGELSPTTVYSLSPKRHYVEDEKRFSISVSNILAYEPGDKKRGSNPNFDMYLKNVLTGERYQVPVRDSVTVSALSSGATGTIKVTFREGDLVDDEGQTIKHIKASELPLGEYAVIVEFKDDDALDLADMLSFETNYTFQVTPDKDTRSRVASILVVVKRVLDLTTDDGEDAERFAEALPGEYGDLSEDEFLDKLATDRNVMEQASRAISSAARKLNPQLGLEDVIDLEAVPVYTVETFESEESFEEFSEELDDDDEVVLEIRGSIRQAGEDGDIEYAVNATTEPAIINKSLAYQGKDITISIDDFPAASRVNGNTNTPFLNALYVLGNGYLSTAHSGFTVHSGQFTIDFYNGFDKTLGSSDDDTTPEEEEWESVRNPEDDSQNGSLGWAYGPIMNAINPFHNLIISDVFINRRDTFHVQSVYIKGASVEMRDLTLKKDGVSFGGIIQFFILEGEVENIVFDQQGFVGIESTLSFGLDSSMGMFKGDEDMIGGSISVTHYKDPKKYGVQNQYALSFEASLEDIMGISAELAFKMVDDGRVLPDVIAFGTDLPDPGILVYIATYISGIRGAIRELADTIAGGQKRIPLTLEAGIDVNFGIAPALFNGSVDLTLKLTGFKVAGSLSIGPMDMLEEAMFQAQWVSPWFLTARSKIDVSGWGIIVGTGSIFVGENLEKHRVDFEGLIGARLQIPTVIPVIGGFGLGITAGVNNDKLWAGLNLLFLTLGITYYWGGGISFSTDGTVNGKDALYYMQVNDPEHGPTILAIGEGIEVLATSWETDESERSEITYRAIAEGIDMIESGSQNLGIGGIKISNSAKVHRIPMDKVTDDALLEIEYDETKLPKLTLQREDGSTYVIDIGEITDTEANAYEQIVPALQEGAVKGDGTIVSKQEALESTDIRRLYVAVPKSESKTGNWTLTSDRPIRTKLMNIPVQSTLSETTLEPSLSNPDQFTATWTIKNAHVGDTISMYLSKDRLPDAPTENLDIDPGLRIAQNIEVTASDIGPDGTASGTVEIDVSQTEALDGADIRGLIAQGDYYLRTEMRNDTMFSAKSSVGTFQVIDPLAPDKVDAVELKAAGNGMFNVAFQPVEHKAGQENAQYGYVITALDEQGLEYTAFGEEMYTEEQLAASLVNGKYQVSIGGWTLVGKPKLDENGNLVRDSDGNFVMDDEVDRYTGLQPGRIYSIGVQTVRVPSEDDGASENMRFAETTYSPNVLLPAVNKPVLFIDGDKLTNNRYDLLTRLTTQEIEVSANQANVVIEAYGDDKLLSSVQLGAAGESGLLKLSSYRYDGTYAVELRARNTVTGDYSVSMLYVTVDQTAPMIYYHTPENGFHSQDGRVTLKGNSNSDAILTVSDTSTGRILASYKPNEKGEFEIHVPLQSSDKTVELRIEAVDDAGNSNSAVVEVINDDLKLPTKLELVVPENLVSDGTSVQLEAIVTYEDGTIGLADPSMLTFSVERGDSNVLLTEQGVLVGRRLGGALIKVAYEPWEGLTMTASDVVTVAESKPTSAPTTMGTIKGYSLGTGGAGYSRILITSYGHDGNMTGSELAYRLYNEKEDAALPVFDQDISAWQAFPEGEVIQAKNGQYVVIAKRLKANPKLTVASSAPIRVNEYTLSPNALYVGGIRIGLAQGGQGLKLPVLLDDKLTNDIITADAVLDGDRYKLVVNPIEDAFLAAVNRGNMTITLPVQGNLSSLSFKLNAELVRSMQTKNTTLDIESDTGRYVLNPQALNLDEIARLYPGTALKDIEVSVVVEQASQDSIHLDNGSSLIGTPVEFRIEASVGGTTIELHQLSSIVEREIPLPAGETGKGVTTAVKAEADGTIRHVPTRIIVRNGKFYARISSLSNSVYALIGHEATFKDTKSHWAAEEIADLASRLIVSGTGQNLFQPSRDMTRAEFATILSRALGLASVKQEGVNFRDVSKQAWYAEAVYTVASYGLIGGYGSGSFGPNDKVTREQVMVILARALRLTGRDSTVDVEEASGILEAFQDVAAAADWARSDVASVVKSGIITGQKSDLLAPKANMTRAELVVAIRRMLKVSELID